ncbi:hypothetical protein [Streptomyces prunicolor]|uniref:hypothetical protein n=1 Tax=Streptomyces prunicolor TaxID=67348 RepID=UPI00037FEDE2|nr:hypothetical protein [Streptomyces prunicolor]
MSSATATPDLSKSTPETYPPRGSLAPLLATLIALAATVLALIDLFVNGLAETFTHLAVGLAVFGAVRMCVGLALDPYRPPLPDDVTETST